MNINPWCLERTELTPVHVRGRFQVDLKGIMIRSIQNYFYAMFFVEEYSRYVYVEFLHNKTERELTEATMRVISRFNKDVGVPLDEDGRPLENMVRPLKENGLPRVWMHLVGIF